MAYKMVKIGNFQVGLRGDGMIHLEHVHWRDADGNFAEALCGVDDLLALGEYVLSGKIFDTENRK